MKYINLTKGYRAIVDDEDYGRLIAYGSWHWSHGRAVRKNRAGITWMHREILPTPEGFVLDHINADPLDNRRANLQIVTQQQNCFKASRNKNNKTGFKGVHLFKATGKYQAYINKDGYRYHLGYFFNKEEAATAYDKAAKKLFGQFAALNYEEQR